MAASTCMNVLCGGASTTPAECRRGWVLRSGESAALCRKCGSAYEQLIFCEVYHSKETGWRECTSCGKRLHCGCIVSRSLLALLDSGGVNCINCAMNSGLQHKDDTTVTTGSCGKMKLDGILPSKGEIGSTKFSNFNKSCSGSFEVSEEKVGKLNMGAEDIYGSLAETSLSITPRTPISNGFYGAGIDERENNRRSSPFQHAPKSHHLLPKAPKPALPAGLVANANMLSQIRVARPPAQGRGRNQLLPRYWPRITDQELQQISAGSNSTIEPLFEKVLSASDAGRIGRLVLPKACAEAYFPPISQPEGLPLRIMDINGKEWAFQFRFWPNNNSRMYVLEGVTSCIQSMQLQAGDTVTFSRKEPEGILVMGFRKASNSVAMQDIQPSVTPNGPHSSESLVSGVSKNLPVTSSYSRFPQSLKGGTDPNLDALSKQMKPNGHDIGRHKTENHEGGSLSSVLDPERKRAQNIRCKSKRLLFEGQDILELKLTWEEAQDLLRPPPNVKPTIFKIEDHEFEEYEEPPIFGKSSIFVVGSTGGQEQWTQCDSCMKWRRLPIDALLPSKWTCTDNSWDQSRSSCSAQDELAPEELENLFRLNREFKKQRVTVSNKSTPEHESSGLDALANAAILRDNVVATTTKHPRHRPGCSCIVCIQPPSGKGKHKPSCACNVCTTVKRRFKTLMIRKQKRQLECQAERLSLRNQRAKDEARVGNSSGHVSESPQLDFLNIVPKRVSETGKGQIDLNARPD